MMRYIATFHTHLSALMTTKNLKRQKITGRMMPVPRKLSSSCGTCVSYQAEDLHIDCMDVDLEAIFTCGEGDTYQLVYQQPES